MVNVYDIDGNSLDYGCVVCPEQYGALGNGISDDSSAIQSALNNSGVILFSSKKTYKVTTTLRVKANTVIDLNGATINSTNKHLLFNFLSSDTFTGYNGNGNITVKNGTIIGGAISFGHGDCILLENVIFKDSLNDHFLEIAGCRNYIIRNCKFVGMADVQTSVYEYINLDPCVHQAFPWLADGSAFYDGTKNDGITVDNCFFSLGEGEYAYGFNAFGVHGIWDANTFHQNIVLINNVINGFTGCGLRLNNMNNVYVYGNKINVAGDGIRIGDVGQSTKVLIKANVIAASGTAITKANSSTVFQSDDNDINPIFA